MHPHLATGRHGIERPYGDLSGRSAAGEPRRGHDDPMTDAGERAEMSVLTQKLQMRYPAIAASHIQAVVRIEHSRFEGCPIRQFVPLLVERLVCQQLDRLSEGR